MNKMGKKRMVLFGIIILMN